MNIYESSHLLVPAGGSWVTCNMQTKVVISLDIRWKENDLKGRTDGG